MAKNAYRPIMDAWAFWQWQVITRADDDPYLVRLIVLRTPWFQVMLHWFRGSDDMCLHDHPWPFMSIILSGGYWESSPQGTRWYGPGSVLSRRAKWSHRVQVPPGNNTVTLIVTGQKERHWGFHTPFGWIPWRRYVYSVHCPE